MATTQKPDTISEPMRIILRGVPWAAYKALRDVPANNHIRMTYLDGTLELMSPEYVHDRGARRLDILVCEVASAFGVNYEGIGTTTLRRRRRRPLKGQARESDASFYFGALVAADRRHEEGSTFESIHPPTWRSRSTIRPIPDGSSASTLACVCPKSGAMTSKTRPSGSGDWGRQGSTWRSSKALHCRC